MNFDEIQKNLEDKYINKPLAEEQLIDETAAAVARELAFRVNNTARVEFDEEVFTFKAERIIKDFKNLIVMFVINEEHKALALKAKQPYRPYMITAEIENGMTLTENLKAVVESFFRHITGNIQPEELPN